MPSDPVDDADRRLLNSTVLKHPAGGSEVVVHDGSDDLAMTAFIAVDSEDLLDPSEMR
jgi:hypothetical protein